MGLFRKIRKNFKHETFSFLGIKFNLKTKEYCFLKRFCTNLNLADYGQNNRISIPIKPASKAFLRKGGGDLNAKIFGNNNLIQLSNITPSKLNLNIYGNNNTIILSDDIKINGFINIGTAEYNVHNSKIFIGKNVIINNLNISIINGGNQELKIEGNNFIEELPASLFSDTKLLIKEKTNIYNCPRCVLQKNAVVEIGENNHIVDIFIDVDKHSKIKIGNNCAFSWQTVLYPDDQHSILDMQNNILNKTPHEIIIGNHCWIGFGCKFLHNAQIQDNTIVGMNSLINKKFTESHIIIAGQPAKIIKNNIRWDLSTPTDYLEKISIINNLK